MREATSADLGPWTPGTPSQASNSVPNTSWLPETQINGLGKRQPVFQKPLHQPMPLSPRTPGFVRHPHPSPHPQQQPITSHTPGALPDPSLARSGSARLQRPSPTLGLASPVPSKAAPMSLPNIQPPQQQAPPLPQQAQHVHTLQGLLEEGSPQRLGEERCALGKRIYLEPKGSLAHCVSEQLGRVSGDGRVSKEPQEQAGLLGAQSLQLGSAVWEAGKAHHRAPTHLTDLEARRKALALVAFVRHSTADLQAAAKLADACGSVGPPPALQPRPIPNLLTAAPSHVAGGMPHPQAQQDDRESRQQPMAENSWQQPPSRGVFSPQLETWHHSTELPGSLYALSPELQGASGFHAADSQWPPKLPPTPEGGAEPPLHLPQLVPAPSSSQQPASSLNGIGHPVLSRDGRAARTLVESHEVQEGTCGMGLKHAPQGADLGRSKGKDLHSALQGSSLFNCHSDAQALRDGPSSPKRLSPAQIRELLSMGTTNRRSSRVLMSKETLPMLRVSQPAPNPAFTVHLDLWGGKRLNMRERKVDRQLHQLLMNTTAKVDLADRVNSYVGDREAKAAEQAALTLLANERREQRTITFMQRQAMYSVNKSGTTNDPGRNQQRQAITAVPKKHALFHPVTGEPVDDGLPTPLSSSQYWAGFVALMQHVRKLGTHVMNERHRKLEVQHHAARKIQAAWKGYRCREPLLQMKRAATQKHRDDSQAITVQDAADMIMHFLLVRLEAGRKEAAAAAMRATAAQARAAKSRAELMRGIRLAMMIKQWDKVEAAAIGASQRRKRGNTALGVVEKSSQQQRSMMEDFLSARKKGDMPDLADGWAGARYTLALIPARHKQYTDEQKEIAIKKSIHTALNRTFATDKVILENWKAVPEAVKSAILTVFIKLKTDAYVRLIGLVWQARARYKILKRKRDNMDAARDVLGRTEIGEHSRGRSPVSVGNQGHRSRSFSRGPDRGGPGEPGLEDSNAASSANQDGHHYGSGSSLPNKKSGLSSQGGSRGSPSGALSPDPSKGAVSVGSGPKADAGAPPPPLPSSLLAAAGEGSQAATGPPVPDGGAVVGAGQAAGAPHHQQPQQQRWQDAGSAPLGADEGEDGEDTEEREGSGSRNFKYNQSARKRYFALARSRRSSVGYKARGRSRIERSLDAQALLEEGKGPPVLPPPKMFATLMEMKAIMQQGVMETPLYNGFMLKGSISAHAHNFNSHISKAFEAVDKKTKRQLYKAHHRMHGKNQRGTIHILHRRESEAGGEQRPITQATDSWTVALLTARWHAECFPRTQACLNKRLNMLRVDLLDCLMHGKVTQPEDMGQHLQQLTL